MCTVRCHYQSPFIFVGFLECREWLYLPQKKPHPPPIKKFYYPLLLVFCIAVPCVCSPFVYICIDQLRQRTYMGPHDYVPCGWWSRVFSYSKSSTKFVFHTILFVLLIEQKVEKGVCPQLTVQKKKAFIKLFTHHCVKLEFPVKCVQKLDA